jgi:hypothetical protein
MARKLVRSKQSKKVKSSGRKNHMTEMEKKSRRHHNQGLNMRKEERYYVS